MAAVPSPDGRHDDLDSAELEGLALLVPDDPRSLEGDRLAYLREQRLGARSGWRRFAPGLPGSGLLGTGLAGPVVLVLLVVVGLVGSTLSVFGGTAATIRTPTPLNTAPSAPVGQVGGLLPDIQVSAEGSMVSLRRAHPAVLAMTPTPCDTQCGRALVSLRAQASEYGLVFILVGATEQADQLDELARDDLAGTVTVAIDASGTMAATYGPSGVTLILVHADGTEAAIDRDLTDSQHIESQLVQLDPNPAGTPSA